MERDGRSLAAGGPRKREGAPALCTRWLTAAPGVAALLFLLPALASGALGPYHQDEAEGFSIAPPAGWSAVSGAPNSPMRVILQDKPFDGYIANITVVTVPGEGIDIYNAGPRARVVEQIKTGLQGAFNPFQYLGDDIVTIGDRRALRLRYQGTQRPSGAPIRGMTVILHEGSKDYHVTATALQKHWGRYESRLMASIRSLRIRRTGPAPDRPPVVVRGGPRDGPRDGPIGPGEGGPPQSTTTVVGLDFTALKLPGWVPRQDMMSGGRQVVFTDRDGTRYTAAVDLGRTKSAGGDLADAKQREAVLRQMTASLAAAFRNFRVTRQGLTKNVDRGRTPALEIRGEGRQGRRTARLVMLVMFHDQKAFILTATVYNNDRALLERLRSTMAAFELYHKPTPVRREPPGGRPPRPVGGGARPVPPRPVGGGARPAPPGAPPAAESPPASPSSARPEVDLARPSFD